jgi:hypothetical protein
MKDEDAGWDEIILRPCSVNPINNGMDGIGKSCEEI